MTRGWKCDKCNEWQQGTPIYKADYRLLQYVTFDDDGKEEREFAGIYGEPTIYKEDSKEPYWEKVTEQQPDLCKKCFVKVWKQGHL